MVLIKDKKTELIDSSRGIRICMRIVEFTDQNKSNQESCNSAK